ncbi:hypothetical protein FRC05_001349 [Tulasnella sp. 425]|nr:hypothetical protein FRC05_001349 [Tulasnella sp. 425]
MKEQKVQISEKRPEVLGYRNRPTSGAPLQLFKEHAKSSLDHHNPLFFRLYRASYTLNCIPNGSTIAIVIYPMARKKQIIVSANNTNVNHVTRLRQSSLPPRSRLFGPDGQPIPFPITNPWDAEADPEDISNTLIPTTPLLDAARSLRLTRHGDEEKYQAVVAGWEKDLRKLIDPRLFDYMVGVEKANRQLDRDARIFLAVKVAEYRKEYRGPQSSASNESKAFKNRAIMAAFDALPDLAPENRVFKTEEAELAYTPQFDIYFRGRIAACDKKEKEWSGTGVSKRVTKLEEIFLASLKRSKTTLDAWLGTFKTDATVWEDIEKKEAELTEDWLAAHPDGSLDDNRLQLDRAAKRKIFEEECKKNPKLYDEAKAAAAGLKAKSGTISAAARAENTVDAVATLGYLTSRVTDLADISVTLIVVGDFGEGSYNAYVNQYGFPRGQALVDTRKDSAWAKNFLPLLSDFVSRISENTELRVGEVLPNLEASALDKPTPKEARPSQKDVKLVPYDWKLPRTADRAKAYFETNICNLRGISSVMWRTITNKTEPYLRGLPDVVFWETKQYDLDSETGKIIPHPAVFSNPATWSDHTLFMWEDHIAKSEDGLLPSSQTLGFVDRNGQVHLACDALDKSPKQDGSSNITVAVAGTGGKAAGDEESEDFTDGIMQVGASEDDDEDLPDLEPDSEEKARDSVIRIKRERMARTNLDLDTLTARVETLPNHSTIPSIPSASAPGSSDYEVCYPTSYSHAGPPPVEILQKDRYIRRLLEVIPWHGLPSPIPRGPQLSAAIEAIALDELLSFDAILSDSPDLAERIRPLPERFANESPLIYHMLKAHWERLFDLQQSPPQIHTSEDLYGSSFTEILLSALSSIEEAVRQLFVPSAFLRWRLGSPNGLILLHRALSALSPLQSHPAIKERFLWVAIRLHYFAILVLSVRRSILASKSFLSQLPSQSSSTNISSGPFAAFLTAWEDALECRLQTWSRLVEMNDLSPLMEVVGPNGSVGDPSCSGIYFHATQVRWYDVPKPGIGWQIKLPFSSASHLPSVQYLQSIDSGGLTISSLCHFGTAIVGLMAAACSTHGWEGNPSWAVLIRSMNASASWRFDTPIPSSSSDTADDMVDHEPLGITLTPDRPQESQRSRSGTPASPSSSPKPSDIIQDRAAPMRSNAGRHTQGLDGQHREEDVQLFDPSLEQPDVNEMPNARTENGVNGPEPDSGMEVEESPQTGPETGGDTTATQLEPDGTENTMLKAAINETGGVGDASAERPLPKKPYNRRVPPGPPERTLRTRTQQPSTVKRKSEDIAKTEAPEDPGPSVTKRVRTRSATRAEPAEVEPAEVPDPKSKRAKAKAASKAKPAPSKKGSRK